jgi:hypothetical protein
LCAGADGVCAMKERGTLVVHCCTHGCFRMCVAAQLGRNAGNAWWLRVCHSATFCPQFEACVCSCGRGVCGSPGCLWVSAAPAWLTRGSGGPLVQQPVTRDVLVCFSLVWAHTSARIAQGVWCDSGSTAGHRCIFAVCCRTDAAPLCCFGSEFPGHLCRQRALGQRALGQPNAACLLRSARGTDACAARGCAVMC